MNVTAYKCPHCGARLRPTPTDLQVSCEYCGTISTIQRKTGMFRAPPRPRPPGAPHQPVAHASMASGVWITLVFVGVMVVSSTGAFLFRTSASAGTATTKSVASEYTRGATYVEGEAVKLWYGSRWYDATIKQVRSRGRYLVGYDGWSDSWDEVVTNERLQKIAAPAPEPEPEPDPEPEPELEYVEGEGVFVLWRGSWYAGTIKEVRGDGTYFIGYDGYRSSWDEEVDTSRLRKRP